jgi:hypothetical protein
MSPGTRPTAAPAMRGSKVSCRRLMQINSFDGILIHAWRRTTFGYVSEAAGHGRRSVSFRRFVDMLAQPTPPSEAHPRFPLILLFTILQVVLQS